MILICYLHFYHNLMSLKETLMQDIDITQKKKKTLTISNLSVGYFTNY